MTAADTRPTAVGLRSERGPVLAALMMTTSLVALDSTVIATAVPSIVADLGGFSQFPWLFSIYLIAQAVTVPIYGKLADVFGRRPVMFFGIAAFLLGSALCAAAWSLPALIAARAVQGIGAGAVQPMGMTIIGDLYTLAERARVQGYIASVWAVSALTGPFVGGLFSEYLSWRWIFVVNLPLGALAAWMLARRFAEKVTRTSPSVDYLGAGLLTVGCSLLILGLLEGGVRWDWDAPPSIAILATGAASLAAFVLVEHRAAEPVLPLWVFTRRTLVAGNLTAVAVGALLIGYSSYVPTYVQGVLGKGPLQAGFALATLSIGWPLAASLSGRLYLRIGFRDTALTGAVLVVAGSALAALTLGGDSSVWLVAGACMLVGLGLGFSSSPALVCVQSVVGWDRRGVVTGANMFGRSIGSAVGVAVFGAVANATLASRFASPPPSVAGRLPADVDSAGDILDGATSLPADVLAFARSALSDASHTVFTGLVVIALVLAVAVAFLPRKAELLVFE